MPEMRRVCALAERVMARKPVLWAMQHANDAAIRQRAKLAAVHLQKPCDAHDLETVHVEHSGALEYKALVLQAMLDQCGISNCFSQRTGPVLFVSVGTNSAKRVFHGQVILFVTTIGQT